MNGELIFVRKWNAARDAVAHDAPGDKRERAIYLHTWRTGSQELVFDDEAAARGFAEREGLVFSKRAPRLRHRSRRTEKRIADRIDGYDRDDLGESPDF